MVYIVSIFHTLMRNCIHTVYTLPVNIIRWCIFSIYKNMVHDYYMSSSIYFSCIKRNISIFVLSSFPTNCLFQNENSKCFIAPPSNQMWIHIGWMWVSYIIDGMDQSSFPTVICVLKFVTRSLCQFIAKNLYGTLVLCIYDMKHYLFIVHTKAWRRKCN